MTKWPWQLEHLLSKFLHPAHLTKLQSSKFLQQYKKHDLLKISQHYSVSGHNKSVPAMQYFNLIILFNLKGRFSTSISWHTEKVLNLSKDSISFKKKQFSRHRNAHLGDHIPQCHLHSLLIYDPPLSHRGTPADHLWYNVPLSCGWRLLL